MGARDIHAEGAESLAAYHRGLLAARDSKLSEYRRSVRVEDHRTLTDSEYSTLFFAAYGFTAAETGRVIHLGAETIKSYRKSIAMKLESKNITHSVVIAMKQGWL